MQLAADDISIQLANTRLILRPTLRAATRLERRFGGFQPLAHAITKGNITALAQVIQETAAQPTELPDLLYEFAAWPLRDTLAAITGPCLEVIIALAGGDQEQSQPSGKSTSSTTYSEFFEQLFQIATGVLGWSPDAAWKATPAEIVTAYRGRMDLLKQIFGSSSDADEDAYDPTNTAFDREGLAQLKMMGI
ncbi:hypothetical protein [Terrihabitans rhizophilus]|uniref:Tail assembly chaperone n=1 Tax=Terrihabitans rhizophilus TaxID=3092662 RepID=A0ABU4RP94_9HYPH|nr:hypothetical protein [Terrihabitans sp. PJ23]MDX6806426.1 hypothetical protein [Terrihabitans sp. PJ23]